MNYSNWSTQQWWKAADMAAQLGKSVDTVYHHLRMLREQKGVSLRFPLQPSEAEYLAGFITCKRRK